MTIKVILICFLITSIQACTAKEQFEFSQRSRRLQCEDNIISNNAMEYNECLKNTNIPYEEYIEDYK